MFVRTTSSVGGLFVLLLLVNPLCAEEPPRKEAQRAVPAARSDLFRLGEMAQAAADLHKAGEAFARFADSLDGLAESIAKSLATMSSEFDPFGYKTAFRTVGRQAEMLEKQRTIIQALHEAEIERLRKENKKLRNEVTKLRKRKGGRGK